jgi:hypothetical protein
VPGVIEGQVVGPARHRRFEPEAPLAPTSRSWFATGIYIMALPMTLGMAIVFAPVSWMLGSRSKR